MPQAIWTGQIRLSLVNIPVRLFPATTGTRRLALHQIHEPSGKRIRYEKVAPGVGPVDKDEIVKGYEYERGKYVLLSDEEIEDLKIESKQTIELTRFVEHCGIDPRYYEKPYYVLPDGDAAMEAYATLRKALDDTKRIGIGHFVLRGRDVVAAVKPCGKGIMLETLRHEHEIRKADQYFSELEDVSIDKEALSLAEELIERKEGDFDAKELKDDYYDAMRELIDAKLEKRAPHIAAEAPRSAKVINFKDALRKSVKGKSETKKPKKRAAARRSRPTKTSRKKSSKAKSSTRKSSAKARKSA